MIISLVICLILITECYTYIKNTKVSIPISVLLAFAYEFVYVGSGYIFEDMVNKISGFLLMESLNFPCYWLGGKLKIFLEQSMTEKKKAT